MDEFDEAIRRIELKKSQLHVITIKDELELIGYVCVVLGVAWFGVIAALWWVS